MYSFASLQEVMMESLFLQLDDMQWKSVHVVGEAALAGILSNC